MTSCPSGLREQPAKLSLGNWCLGSNPRLVAKNHFSVVVTFSSLKYIIFIPLVVYFGVL